MTGVWACPFARPFASSTRGCVTWSDGQGWRYRARTVSLPAAPHAGRRGGAQ
jgi:hypothetical protein